MNKLKNISVALLFVLLSACSQNAITMPIMQDTNLSNINSADKVEDSKAVSELLKKSATGLIMISESDYPLKNFIWKDQAVTALNKTKLLKIIGKTSTTAVEETTVDRVFQAATSEYPGQDAEEKATVKKFKNLVGVIKTNLKNIKVYRVGQISIDVYIVGTVGNDLVGLSTTLVETRR